MNANAVYADRRQFCRIDLEEKPWAVKLENEDHKLIDAEILDISLGGIRVRVGTAFNEIKAAIGIVLNQLQARAEVMWQSGTEIGLRFLDSVTGTPIDIMECILRGELATTLPSNNVLAFKNR